MLTSELLEKFKRIFQEQFNTILSDEEATLMATDFLNTMKILVTPDPEELDIQQEENKNLPERKAHEAQQI